MRHVAARQLEAHSRHPLERPWGPRVLERNLAEYERADSIFFATEHIRDSFLAEGVPRGAPARCSRSPPTRATSPRGAGLQPRSSFEILYVGSLSVSRACRCSSTRVRRLDAPELRLVLLGGWASRGMRRFLSGRV